MSTCSLQSSSPRPAWLKVKAPNSPTYHHIRHMLQNLGLVTVCQEALCPNIEECWGGGTATFMLMGDTCTRACRFCAVKTGNPKGILDAGEPGKVAHAIGQMGLNYAVLTSVDRDDLEDFGAEHFARTITTIKKRNPSLLVECLTPDFNACRHAINTVVASGPDVFAHNVETVERLTPSVRDRRSGYWQSLKVLELVKKERACQYTKTSLMLGLGESEGEVRQTLRDLRSVGCDVITFGQYLAPTVRHKKHLPVVEYVHPDKFAQWQDLCYQLGFLYCAAGPLVRSSYRAGEYFMRGVIERGRAAGLP